MSESDTLAAAAAILRARWETLCDEDRNETWHYRRELESAAHLLEDLSGVS